jgi:hypothetical protein
VVSKCASGIHSSGFDGIGYPAIILIVWTAPFLPIRGNFQPLKKKISPKVVNSPKI